MIKIYRNWHSVPKNHQKVIVIPVVFSNDGEIKFYQRISYSDEIINEYATGGVILDHD